MKWGLRLGAPAFAIMVSAAMADTAMSGTGHHQMGGMSGDVADSMRAMGDQMVGELTPLRGRDFDIRFAQRMSDHHQMAIDMAKMEVRSGKNARVRDSAQRVITAQQREIALMKGWIKLWTGQSYTPKSMPMQMNAGSSTDRWFLKGMIPHHRGAIEMADLVMKRTQNAEVRKLATVIMRDQTDEINQYAAWLKVVK